MLGDMVFGVPPPPESSEFFLQENWHIAKTKIIIGSRLVDRFIIMDIDWSIKIIVAGLWPVGLHRHPEVVPAAFAQCTRPLNNARHRDTHR
jgi:hypothetical protein